MSHCSHIGSFINQKQIKEMKLSDDDDDDAIAVTVATAAVAAATGAVAALTAQANFFFQNVKKRRLLFEQYDSSSEEEELSEQDDSTSEEEEVRHIGSMPGKRNLNRDFEGAHNQYKFRTYDATTNSDLSGSWVNLKDLTKSKNVSSDVDVDVDVADLSSLSEGSSGETNKKSSERGGKGAKAAKALLAQAARHGAREEALERRFKRDDERYHITQSKIQNMERSIGMLNQQLKSIADAHALKTMLEVTDDEETRAEVKRKISGISGI
jgi:hypothetical protein